MVELQDKMALPEFVTLFGVITPQVRFAGIVSAKLTVPLKPFTAVIVTVEVAEVPA